MRDYSKADYVNQSTAPASEGRLLHAHCPIEHGTVRDPTRSIDDLQCGHQSGRRQL